MTTPQAGWKERASKFRTAWQRWPSDELLYQRLAGALVVIVVIVGNFPISGLDWQTYAVIALPLIAAYLLWWIVWLICAFLKRRKARRSPPKQPDAGSLEDLIDLINRYCEQKGARQLQHPWLLASLYSYIFGFSLLVYTQARGAAAWIPVIAAAVVAIVCMLLVGYFAEDNPPSSGMETVLAALKDYRARKRSEQEILIRKIYRGDWLMEDLVAFAAVEEQEHVRSEEIKRQNKLLLN